MRGRLIAWLLPAVLLVGCSAGLYFWLTSDAGWDLAERLPGGDGRPREGAAAGGGKIAGRLQTFAAADSVKIHPAPTAAESWPAFRGADRDGIYKGDVRLARQWPAGGPKALWSAEVGEGFAGAAVFAGRVYVVDYDRTGGADVIRCLSLEDGADLWKYSYPVKIKRNHGMSRTVPAVTDKYVVAMGPLCHVTCLDSATGEFKWMINLAGEYGSTPPLWYTGQCPLIEDGRAIIAPAGKDVLMMAVDCETGEVVWKCPNPDGWVMTHSSITPVTFAEKRFYVYCGGDDVKGGVVAASAQDGQVLWRHDVWKVRTNVPAPVRVGEDRLFFSAGYGQTEKGCMMLRLVADGGEIRTETLFVHTAEVFSSMQQTPVFYQGYLYGVRMLDKQLVCMDVEGRIVWASGPAQFGHGPYMIADGMILAMDDDGVLRLAEATAAGYRQLAEARVLEGHEAWAPMALADGKLIVRDTTRMVCLDVAAK